MTKTGKITFLLPLRRTNYRIPDKSIVLYLTPVTLLSSYPRSSAVVTLLCFSVHYFNASRSFTGDGAAYYSGINFTLCSTNLVSAPKAVCGSTKPPGMKQFFAFKVWPCRKDWSAWRSIIMLARIWSLYEAVA